MEVNSRVTDQSTDRCQVRGEQAPVRTEPCGTPKWALTDSDAVELTRTEDGRSER